jgi:hypothetical protein
LAQVSSQPKIKKRALATVRDAEENKLLGDFAPVSAQSKK